MRQDADILYIEDNLDHAELVLRCLERHHARERVVHVEDGERALAVLDEVKAQAAARPKLVLLDLRLPRVDGLEILRHMKATPELRCIPVVVFTTSGGSRDMQEAYANFANSYLVKPDDLAALDALLRDLSVYWLERNCLLGDHSV
ncbi:MAG TPA: response regulator [Polyangiales bacterium]